MVTQNEDAVSGNFNNLEKPLCLVTTFLHAISS